MDAMVTQIGEVVVAELRAAGYMESTIGQYEKTIRALTGYARGQGTSVYDPALAGQLGAIFQEDLQKAKRIDLKQWLRRNSMQHMFETFSRVLDQQS